MTPTMPPCLPGSPPWLAAWTWRQGVTLILMGALTGSTGLTAQPTMPHRLQSNPHLNGITRSIGPLSATDEEGGYNQPYPIIQFETEILASEVNCQPNGEGCVVPPAPARFYPFYALAKDSASPNEQNCALIFGNFSGLDSSRKILEVMRSMARQTCLGSSAKAAVVR